MGPHNFALKCRHVDKETFPQDCDIEGNLPNWLHGYVIYNGPGIVKVGDEEFLHTFDASAILQKFTIENGRVSYCSKFLQSDTYQINKKAGRIMFSEFATPGPASPNLGFFSRIIRAMDPSKVKTSDNAFQTVLQIGNRYFAQAQTPYYLEIDPHTLNVINRTNMQTQCKLNTQTVGIMQDKNGYFYSMGLTFRITGMKYALIKFPKDGNVAEGKTVATFNCRWRMSPSYIHTAAMTENHLIFIETPLTISVMDWLSEFGTTVPFANILKWNDDKNCLIRVIELETWTECTNKFATDPFFNLYYGNAYEEPDHVVVDVCAYKDSTLINRMYVKSLRDQSNNVNTNHESFIEAFSPYLRRYVIPLNPPESKEQDENLITLPNTSCKAFRDGNEIHLTYELRSDLPFGSEPTISPWLEVPGKSRYLYSYCGSTTQEENSNKLSKVNVDTKEAWTFQEEDLYPTKPIFVPTPKGKEEDDGVLLSLCIRSSDSNYLALLILDAKTMTEVCRIQTKLETETSFPIHGAFIPF